MRKRDDKRTVQPYRQGSSGLELRALTVEENQIKEDLKNDLFILMLFDDLLKDSELTQEDVDDLDHRMKREIMEKLGWR
jgi:hypothetical protein